jgi:RHS repeat-associated protein
MSGYDVGLNNRLLSDGVYDYEHDEEGNVVARERIATGEREEYAWDHRNRLVQVTMRDEWGSVVRTVAHSYDYQNRWVRRAVDPDGPGGAPAIDAFFAHFEGQIALEFAGPDDADLAHRYLWGPAVDQILADERVDAPATPGTILWPLTDHLQTTRDLAERDEVTGEVAIVNHLHFDSYGQMLSQSDAGYSILFGFTGRPLDGSTGLQNNGARWYADGRWLSEDPIGFFGGTANLYEYVGNAPTMYVDPDGWERTWGEYTSQLSSSLATNFASDYLHYVSNPSTMGPYLKFGFYASTAVATTAAAGAGLIVLAGAWTTGTAVA